MSEGLKLQNSQGRSIKILIDKYPKIIIVKAVLNLLDTQENVNLENLENEINRITYKKINGPFKAHLFFIITTAAPEMTKIQDKKV